MGAVWLAQKMVKMLLFCTLLSAFRDKNISLRLLFNIQYLTPTASPPAYAGGPHSPHEVSVL